MVVAQEVVCWCGKNTFGTCANFTGRARLKKYCLACTEGRSTLAWACALARTDYVFTSDNFAHVFCDLLQSVRRSSPAAIRRALSCREARGKKEICSRGARKDY